jgi:adenylate cyclase
MRAQRRPELAVLAALSLALLTAQGAGAAIKTRTVIVLPYATVDLGREEQWIGEGIAQSLTIGLVQMSALIQIDRERLKRLSRSDAWDDQAALVAARTLGADVAVYGEVRRAGTDLSIVPRYVELKGDKSERVALDPVAVPDGTLMERLRGLPVAYARALKITLSESESARVQKWASPTTSQRAFEAFVRGQEAAYRGGQDGNEVAVELIGKAIEIDPQFVVAQYTLGAVHQNLGNRWKAAAQFRASTQLDAAYPEAYKALGDLSLAAPRPLVDQAIEAYAKALEIRPFYAGAHVGLGDAKAAKGDVDGAVVAYQKALGYNPLNA